MTTGWIDCPEADSSYAVRGREGARVDISWSHLANSQNSIRQSEVPVIVETTELSIGTQLNQCACVNPRAVPLLNMAVMSRVPASSVYCLKSKVDFSPARGDVYVFEIAQLNR